MTRTTKVNLLITTAATLMALNANAETNIDATPYVGASLAATSFTEEITNGPDYETDHFLVGLRAGLKFNDYLSGEFRFGLGDKDTTTYNGENWETEIDQYMGIYVKAHYPVNEQVNLYGLVGKTKLKYSESYSYTDPDPFYSYNGAYSESEQDTTLGLGLEYAAETTGTPILLGVEYIKYYEKNDVSLGGLSLSVLFEL